MNRNDAVRGALLGTAVGDALGLPWEGMSADAVQRRMSGRPAYAFLGRRGLISDDTEQSYLVGAAFVRAADDPTRFQLELARGLRRWFLALPPGIGLGTARAMVRLLVGFGPQRSGVHTAGNGAAMRVALLGVLLPREQIAEWVHASTVVTHTDPRAYAGAYVVAVAAHVGARSGMDHRHAQADEVVAAAQGDELVRNLQLAIGYARDRRSGADLTRALGIAGFVTGYVNHTVPAAIFCWLRHDTFEAAVAEAVGLGGDTDTVGAIVGGVMGATIGSSGIPADWLAGLGDWPLSRERLDGLADALSGVDNPVGLPWLPLLVRNLGALGLFVCHIVWRRRPW